MKRASILVTIALCAAAGTALAQTAEDRTACEPDVWRLCSGYIPNIGAIKGCLKEQRQALSRACRMVVDGSTGRRRRSAAAR